MENLHTTPELLKRLPDFKSHFAELNGVRIHYVEGGHGQPLILIPGYPQTWWAYEKIMPALAARFRVIVVELRGMGDSAKPEAGYDKKTMAKDIYELTRKLGLDQVAIAGHDIGAHVAYSFAANFPEATAKLIILDTPHPDAGMYQLPMLPIPGADYVYPWWLALNQVKDLPEQLLEGKMHLVISWMFEKLLEQTDAVSEFDKSVFSLAYGSADAIRAAGGWYRAFGQDIEDMKTYQKLSMPVLAIGGSGYEMLKNAIPLSTTNAQLVKIEHCGHFLLSEKPEETAEHIIDFLA